jgi:hypothetical protein
LAISALFPLRATPAHLVVSIRHPHTRGSFSNGGPRFSDLESGRSLKQEEAAAVIHSRRSQKWVIYIHGYGAGAGDSLKRVAKLTGDGGFNLLMLDWPGGRTFKGIRKAYIHKMYENATESGDRLAPLVKELFWEKEASSLRVAELDLVAHSMGCEVARGILASPALPPGIVETIFIAPCTYADQFESESAALKPKLGHLTVYGATIDKVLFLGHVGNQGARDDTRILGSMHRDKKSDLYDFVNITCQYQGITTLFYAHFPETEAFREDVRKRLDHVDVCQRNLGWVEFNYRTPVKKIRYRYRLWNLGEPDCPKAKRCSMKALAKPCPPAAPAHSNAP